MRERSVYDTRFFVEYFYSGDTGFLRRLKEDLRAVRSKHRIPMADSVIAATAQIHGCPLVSDDAHFQQIPDLKTRWYTTR